MAVIQYQTIEHLNLKELDIVGQAFPVTSVLQQRDFYERVFLHRKKCKNKYLTNSLDFQMFHINVLAGLPKIQKKLFE